MLPGQQSGGCYAGLLSAMICAPALFCVDRSATHTLNGMMDRHDMVPPHQGDLMHPQHGSSYYYHKNRGDAADVSDDEGDNNDAMTAANEGGGEGGRLLNEAWISLLQATGFGTKERKKGQTWADDGKGFDIDNWSEDYWAAGWCSYYAYSSFCCNFMRCRTCNNAPYAPMCFVLMCGAVYPLCLCPSALLLRRSVVGTRNISETCFDSIVRSLFCTPCSLVQTYDEICTTPPEPKTNNDGGMRAISTTDHMSF